MLNEYKLRPRFTKGRRFGDSIGCPARFFFGGVAMDSTVVPVIIPSTVLEDAAKSVLSLAVPPSPILGTLIPPKLKKTMLCSSLQTMRRQNISTHFFPFPSPYHFLLSSLRPV